MENQLLDGFFLKDLLVEPVTGKVTGRGVSRQLASRPVEVLLCLARRPRRLISHREILDKVWGDGCGNVESLSHAISNIRLALHDHADSPEFIQTVRRRGYRLLVEPQPRHGEDEIFPDRSVPVAHGFWKVLVQHGVVQASAAYLVTGWLLIQVGDATFDNLGLPSWALPFVTFMVAGGFPLVVLLAWFLEFAEGRMLRDRGRQSGGWFKGLERNYLAIVAAYGIAALGAGIYQQVVGFRASSSAIGMAVSAPELIPVADNSIAVMKLLNIDGSDRTRVFSAGLSEDILDRLARLPGLRVASRSDAWSLPPNASSDVVRRRLRVAYFLEGSVRIVGNKLRIVTQLIDSETGFHVVSRSFNKDLRDYVAVQKEITGLIVANLRVALPDESVQMAASGSDEADVDAYILYHRGRDVLSRPATHESIQQAQNYFEQALAIDPEFAAAHAGRCTAFISLYELEHNGENVNAAERACSIALAAGAQLPSVHNAVGRLYLLTGRIPEAKAAFDSALQLDEQDVVAIKGLATVLQQQQQLTEAEKLLKQAIELQPGNWNSFNIYGNFLFRLGRYRDAAEQYRRVVYLDSENFVVMGNLGSALLMAGKFDDARLAFEKSLEIESNEAMYSNLAIVYYYLGRFDQSVAIHRKAVGLSPGSHVAWLNLADALYFSGEQDAAQQAFTRSAVLSERQLAVNPSNAEALYLLAWAETMQGKDVDAARHIDRALSLAPNDPYSHYYDSLIKVRHGDFTAATSAIAVAVKLGYPKSMLAAEPYLRQLHGITAFSELLESQARN